MDPTPNLEAELPPLSEAEQAKKKEFDRYGLGLSLWLSDKVEQVRGRPNPLLGQWQVVDGTGSFIFGKSDFIWHEDHQTPDRNFYQGTYSFLPGALTVTGYVLDRDGQECCSVFQHYRKQNLDGQDQPINFYGVLIVQTTTAGNLYVLNQRTGGELELQRTADTGRP